MADPLSLAVSVFALAVSGMTAWLTLFRRGTVRMTRPSVIYFGPDLPRRGNGVEFLPKVYLRTLLFATSKRGRVVESMHVTLTRNETRQNFNIWAHSQGKLVRGSGLFVGETGVSADHHFLTPDDGRLFAFTEGRYQIEVFVRLVGGARNVLLFSQALDVTREAAAALAQPGTGLYFDWGPDSASYMPHVERHLPPPNPVDTMKLLDRSED